MGFVESSEVMCNVLSLDHISAMTAPDAIPHNTWTKPIMKTKTTQDGRILTENEALDREDRATTKKIAAEVKDRAILQQR